MRSRNAVGAARQEGKAFDHPRVGLAAFLAQGGRRAFTRLAAPQGARQPRMTGGTRRVGEWRAVAPRRRLLAAILVGALAGCTMAGPQSSGRGQANSADPAAMTTLPPGMATAGNRAAMTVRPKMTATAANPAAATTQSQAAPGGASLPPAMPPADAQLLLQQAEAELAAGDSLKAADDFLEVLQSDPHNSQALIGIGESYLAAREPKKALEAFEQVERDAPDLRARALQGQGLSLSAIGQREEGQRRLLEALKLDPGLWRAWNAAGVNYDEMRAWADARASYEKAVEAAPSAAAAVSNNEGMSLLLQGKGREAEAAFQDALMLEPRSKVIRANLRIALAAQGRYDEALAAVPSNQLPSALNNVGYIAMARGDYTAAEKYLNQAMQASPAYFEKAAKNLAYVEYLISKSAAKPRGRE